MINPLRKPRAYDRKKSRIDTSGMLLPKRHPVRSAGRRAYVRRHPCALFGEDFGDCPTRRIECAHVETGGLAIKCPDDLTAPLCSAPGVDGHHRQYDEHRLPKKAREIVARKAKRINDEWTSKQLEKQTARKKGARR